MEEDAVGAGAGELPSKVQLSVKRGPIWPGGFLDASIRLEGRQLMVETPPQELDWLKRGALSCFYGEPALAELKARRPVVLGVDVDEAELRVAGTKIVGRLDGAVRFALLFLNMDSVAATAGRPTATLTATARVLGKRGDAKAAAARWDEAIKALDQRS